MVLSEAFYRRGIIETRGSGTNKIIEWTTDAGLAASQFESRDDRVIVRFFSKQPAAPAQAPHDLSPLQRKLVQVVATAGTALLSQIRTQLGEPVPDRTLQKSLHLLRSLKILDLKGTGRGARWILQGAYRGDSVL